MSEENSWTGSLEDAVALYGQHLTGPSVINIGWIRRLYFESEGPSPWWLMEQTNKKTMLDAIESTGLRFGAGSNEKWTGETLRFFLRALAARNEQSLTAQCINEAYKAGIIPSNVTIKNVMGTDNPEELLTAISSGGSQESDDSHLMARDRLLHGAWTAKGQGVEVDLE